MGTQKRLTSYLRSVADRPFEWGKHDCLTFTNDAWRSMYSDGWADDWLGRYMIKVPYGIRPMRASELRSEFKFDSLEEGIDDKLTRINYIPPRGSLVATSSVAVWGVGYAMGISVGMKAAFLSKQGVIYIPITDVSKAWI